MGSVSACRGDAVVSPSPGIAIFPRRRAGSGRRARDGQFSRFRRQHRGAVLTSSEGARDERAPSADRSWHVALLTETEPGRRNRRTSDSVLLVWAAIVIGLSFGWAGALWRTALVGLLGL